MRLAQNISLGFSATPMPLCASWQRSYFSTALHPFDVANGNEGVEANMVLGTAPDRKHHQGETGMGVNISLAVLALSLVLALARPVSAQVTVGGTPMYANRDVAGNAANSKKRAMLVVAVPPGPVDTLSG